MTLRFLSLLGLVALSAACSTTSPGSDAATPDAGTTDARTDDASPAPDAGACPTSGELRLEPATTDVLWLADRSASFTPRADRRAGAGDAIHDVIAGWTTAEHALLPFPVLVAGTGEVSCVVTDYDLELDWGMTADAFRTAFAAHTFAGDSPLDAALDGAIDAAREIRSDGGTVAIVIVTDASPFTDEACESGDWPHVAEIAAAGLADGIHTHFLSIVAGGVSADHFGRMGEIATGGDGFAGIVNGSRTDVASQSRNFLAAVRDHMEGCNFVVPPGVTPGSITLTVGDGTPQTISRVAGPADCDPTSFYLDASGRTLTLCSGEGGVGGLCQLTYLAARTMGAPTVTTACE